MTKIKIDKIFTNTESKSTGKPFKTPMLAIYSKDIVTEKNPKGACSGFVGTDSPALKWKDGEEVELELVEKNGFMNFQDPFKPSVKAQADVKSLEQRVAALEAFVFPEEK